MTEEIILKEIEVTKLRLRPGDVVVVHLPEHTRNSWMQKLAMHLTKMLPRNPSLLIANNVTISVMSAEEAQALKQEIKERADASKDQSNPNG